MSRALTLVVVLSLAGPSALASRVVPGKIVPKPADLLVGSPAPLPVRDAQATRAGRAPIPILDGVPLADRVRSESVQSGWVFYYFYVPAGSTVLTVDLSALSADADLYVRRNGEPTLSSYDCRSNASGGASEQCAFSAPSEGLWWVGVNAYDVATIDFQLQATWVCGAPACDAFPLENGLLVSDTIDGSTQQSAFNDYYVGLQAGGSVLQVDVTNMTGDVDLYLRRQGLPDLTAFDCRSWNVGLADETCVVALPSSGLWWVSVNNYDVGPIDYDIAATWLVKLQDGSVDHDTIVSGTSQQGWVDAYLDVPTGASRLDVVVENLTGDADLYLRAQDLPTTATFDCASTQVGAASEFCSVTNPPPGRYFVSVNNFDVGKINYSLGVAVDCSAGCARREGLTVGLGPGPNSPPRSAFVEHDVVTGGYATGITPYDHYGTLQAGVNVDGIDLDTVGLGEQLTGPGNQAVFGPHVRAWRLLGLPVAGVNFYAYGTLRYGVKVRSIRGDSDAYDEIVTGAGQGSVFAPHVRAWNYDAAGIQVTPVNFFAYSGLLYGVNLGAVNLESSGNDELLTAPVFGTGYPTRVRGWDVDISQQVSPIAAVDFLAFDDPDDHGAGVAGGDVDGDGYAEILATRGPYPGLPANVRGFTWDGTTVFLAPELDHLPFASSYGANVVTADVDADGDVEIVSAPGPDPGAAPTLAARDWTGSLDPIPGLDGLQPFVVEAPNAREGATLGSGSR